MAGLNDNASTPPQSQPLNSQETSVSEWWRGLNIRKPLNESLWPLPVAQFGSYGYQNPSNTLSYPQLNLSNPPPVPHPRDRGNTVISEPQISCLPPALANYKLVVTDKNVFMTTLKKHHHDMKKKLIIPKVGCFPLDLHKLFVAVTSHGGVKKVTRERKWIKVGHFFNFPRGSMNAPYILRIHYEAILQTYEYAYFLPADRQIVEEVTRKTMANKVKTLLKSGTMQMSLPMPSSTINFETGTSSSSSLINRIPSGKNDYCAIQTGFRITQYDFSHLKLKGKMDNSESLPPPPPPPPPPPAPTAVQVDVPAADDNDDDFPWADVSIAELLGDDFDVPAEEGNSSNPMDFGFDNLFDDDWLRSIQFDNHLPDDHDGDDLIEFDSLFNF